MTLVFSVPAAGLQEQQRDAGALLVETFKASVREYVATHRQVERYLPPQKNFTDPVEAERSMSAMADAMRLMRPHAREGDLFGKALSDHLRREIRLTLQESGYDASAMVDEMITDTPAGVFPPTVNEAFPWALGNMMPPCLLRMLPALPIELHYRLVGRDLVLIDLHANLVVDILRDAVPSGHHATERIARHS
jgi:hypothetical protein